MLKDCCLDVSSGYQGVTSCSARRSYFRWSYTASYFFPTCAELQTWLGNYFTERCKSLLFIPGSPHLQGPCPHCTKTVSWDMLLKGLFKLSNTLYCRRNNSARMPRRADAAHLALLSSSAATTCCTGPALLSSSLTQHTTNLLSVVPSISSPTVTENKRDCQVWKPIHL